LPSIPFPPVDPIQGAKVGPKVTEQEKESAPEHVLPVIAKQVALEDKKHVKTQESPDRLVIPESDLHGQRPLITGTESSPFHAQPAVPHDEPRGSTHNAQVCISEPYANPSVPIQKSSFSRLIPALREIKQQIEQFAEGRLQRLAHLDQVRATFHSLK
jgi:hypothetical protein